MGNEGGSKRRRNDAPSNGPNSYGGPQGGYGGPSQGSSQGPPPGGYYGAPGPQSGGYNPSSQGYYNAGNPVTPTHASGGGINPTTGEPADWPQMACEARITIEDISIGRIIGNKGATINA